jgi:hypothetical protein
MTSQQGRDRFRHLPEPVRPEDAVESVDVEERRPIGEREVEERFLRDAGAG